VDHKNPPKNTQNKWILQLCLALLYQDPKTKTARMMSIQGVREKVSLLIEFLVRFLLKIQLKEVLFYGHPI